MFTRVPVGLRTTRQKKDCCVCVSALLTCQSTAANRIRHRPFSQQERRTTIRHSFTRTSPDTTQPAHAPPFQNTAPPATANEPQRTIFSPLPTHATPNSRQCATPVGVREQRDRVFGKQKKKPGNNSKIIAARAGLTFVLMLQLASSEIYEKELLKTSSSSL